MKSLNMLVFPGIDMLQKLVMGQGKHDRSATAAGPEKTSNAENAYISTKMADGSDMSSSTNGGTCEPLPGTTIHAFLHKLAGGTCEPLPAIFMSMSPQDMVYQLASSNAVVIFSSTDCCMSTVAKRLLFSLGVGPTIVELDQHAAGATIHAFLHKLAGGTCEPLPAIFIGGKLLGGVQTLFATHMDGTLVPLLKEMVHITLLL